MVFHGSLGQSIGRVNLRPTSIKGQVIMLLLLLQLLLENTITILCPLVIVIPRAVAAAINSLEPQTAAISANAVKSSGALKNGYRPLNIHNKITPADQISNAVVCC